jgi:hypothetical protein
LRSTPQPPLGRRPDDDPTLTEIETTSRFVGEPITGHLLLAAALLALGVWLHLTERHEHEQ